MSSARTWLDFWLSESEFYLKLASEFRMFRKECKQQALFYKAKAFVEYDRHLKRNTDER